MTHRLPIASLLGTLLALTTAGAAATGATATGPSAVTCPAMLPLRPGPLGAAPDAAAAAAGLQLYVAETPLRLTGVSVFDGPPEQGAVLKPARSSRSQVAWALHLAPGTQAWASCDYAGGLARLVKPMAGALRQCSAQLVQRPAPGGLEASLRCD